MIFLKNYSGEMDQVLMFKNDKNLQKISNLNTGPYGPVYREKKLCIKLMSIRPEKPFRTTWGVPEIIAKNWIFALLPHVSAGIPAENAYREGKNPNFCDYLRDAASGPKTFLGPN